MQHSRPSQMQSLLQPAAGGHRSLLNWRASRGPIDLEVKKVREGEGQRGRRSEIREGEGQRSGREKVRVQGGGSSGKGGQEGEPHMLQL